MTKQEIIKRLDELDKAQFFLMMKDVWERADYELDRAYSREIAQLKEELERAE